MANPHLSATHAQFTATVHKDKNRLVAIPAAQQRRLGLARRPDNHVLLISMRKSGAGRWNHRYVKLSQDNEFAIPGDVTSVQGGDEVEVKVHRIIADVEVAIPSLPATGAGLLVSLAGEARPGWREDGSDRLDEYLGAEVTNAPDRLR